MNQATLVRAALLGLALSFAAACGTTEATRRSDGRMATTALLSRGTREPWGYGAYSYVLVPQNPRSDSRYMKLLQAYLQLPRDQPVDPDGMSTPLIERNITYVPVTELQPPPQISLDWLADNYDIGRAAAILHKQGLSDRGPYIVTIVEHPISSADRSDKVAIVDLSPVEDERIGLWVQNFVRVSGSPRDWLRSTTEQLLLELNELMKQVSESVTFTIKSIEPTRKVLSALTVAE